MNLLQLTPSIQVLTPKGPARAVVLIDYGEDHDLLWVCFQDADGECWTWRNHDVRAAPNVSLGVNVRAQANARHGRPSTNPKNR